jgi:hypothetical protein
MLHIALVCLILRTSMKAEFQLTHPLRQIQEIAAQNHPEDYEKELHSLLEAYCTLLRMKGVSVSPFTELSRQRYASYPRELQERIYRGFIKYVSAVLDIVSDGVPLDNTAQSLWCIFKRHQLRPRPDLFSVISERDIVEIYLPNQVQWYRSFNFFRFTSYSLGELICFPWNELIEHENGHLEEFIRISEAMFANIINESVFPNLGDTISRERFSSRGLVARLTPKVISPISNAKGENEAFAIVWAIELIGEASPKADQGVLRQPLTSLQPLELDDVQA